ncbi:MAG: glutamine synthetase family protein [Candidatus Gracilibacteria bacterium]|nr:glutamine synthetase family protein [Candidatus Gracilibacteria bacterium]
MNVRPSLLELDYAELEERNLSVKKDRADGVSNEKFKEKFLKYLEEDKAIKAVTVCFTDMEGRFQMLDYDKKYLLGAYENLTFDGSSIRGFTAQKESDLRLQLDWASFRWLPSDIFGGGKVMIFSNVCDQNGNLYDGDFRARLSALTEKLKKDGIIVNVAPEIEGFVFKGVQAEQSYDEKAGFELATMSGYFNCLPQDNLKLFIDKFAEVKRALGFENEKDHPEVAPAQFELNYKYTEALESADQVQLYKLCARQVAKFMGLTASFLPKPIAGMNGSGMHTNISISKDGVNLFWDEGAENKVSKVARKFLNGILYYANDICLTMNSSVNSYRRLDPAFEAPNEIKVSAVDRGSMIRIPIGNEKSARIEVRTVAPDANPYLSLYSILEAGLAGMNAETSEIAKHEARVSGKVKTLPGNIYDAILLFQKSKFMKEIMGDSSHAKYAKLKMKEADRSPRALGKRVKSSEVLYHHEVTNQLLWSNF